MRKLVSCLSVSAVVVGLAAAGCGGSTPPPAPPPKPATEPPIDQVSPPGAAATGSDATDGGAGATASGPGGASDAQGASAAGAGGAAGGAPSASPSGSTPAGTITSDDIPPECSKAATAYQPTVWPAMNKCYQEGKKKNPDLEGTVHIQVSVNAKGKVGAVKATGTSELGDSVVDCMVKAIKAQPFDGKECKSKSVTIVKIYGGKKP